jgi:hypothetical protein
MARWRVYIKPFLDSGEYAPDFIEVTNDVISLSDISLAIDNTEFDVGVVKNNGVTLKLRNDQARYSDADNIKSIFRSRRKDSIVKITWDIRNYDLICGFFSPGNEPLGGEEEVFQGLLFDVTSISDIRQQNASFKILAFESVLDAIEVPFSSISNGDLFSDIFLTLLDQAPFNTYVTVDAANINPGIDVAIDDKASLEAQTVGEVLSDLLLASNSVLYLKNNTVYVTAREETPDVKKIFYGQASNLGIENLIDIPKIRDGVNRIFNFWNWEETTLVVRDTSSIDLYGVRKKVLSTEIITNNTKRSNILTANRDEFAFPKLEIELVAPFEYSTLALQILDKVQIDHPTIYTANGEVLARYNMSNYGAARYAFNLLAFTLNTNQSFKVLSKKIKTQNNTVSFLLREV